jgi:hypothetical protein
MRKMIMILTAATLGALAAPVAAQTAPISLKSPEAFFTVLEEMGYAPRDFKYNPTLPTMLITVDGQPTSVTLGGCVDKKNCTYMYLSAEFTDIIDPPSDWLESMNVTFDVLKVSRNDKKELYISEAHFIEGLPRDTLRVIFDNWDADGDAVAEEAQVLLKDDTAKP